jgi:small GTP-binding protein
MSYDYLIKYVLTGDASIGKTSMLNQFCDNSFDANYLTTIGVDFKFKTLDIDYNNVNKKIKIQIWDTAGQERFRSITKSYFRGANVILIVFDLTNRESFENVKLWYDSVIDNTYGEKNHIYLVGNKNDLEKDIVINNNDIKNIIKNTKILGYFDVSAKTCNNLNEMFEKISLDCIENNNFKQKHSFINIEANNKNITTNKCC